jgi:uncharacterized damage-inducible protein DinB
MKCLSAVLLLLLAVTCYGQSPAPTSGKYTLVTGVQRTYENIKRNLIAAAERMPEADYGFRPTPQIRSFGQLFGHVANSQFRRCAAARGEANPTDGTDYEKKTTKAEFVQALKDSFAYCDGAYVSFTESNSNDLIRGAGWQGNNQVTRGFALADNVTHNNEMYGTVAVYLRLKGLVPPSSDRMVSPPRP